MPRPTALARRLGRALGIAIALIAVAPVGLAQTLETGTRISAFSIQDQHGQTHRIDDHVKAILFARDMDASRHIDEVLRARSATLEDGRVAWISDISRMPRLISRFVAIPSMRGRPYRMLLDHDGALTRDFPGEAGKVTLLRLDDLRIDRIEKLDSAEALGAALAPLLPEPAER
jgi:hypothetical protein